MNDALPARAKDDRPHSSAKLRKQPPPSAHRPLRHQSSYAAHSARFSAANAAASHHAPARSSVDTSLAQHREHYAPSAREETAPARYSLHEKTSADLLGQRFDSLAVLNSFDAISYDSAQQYPQPPQASAPSSDLPVQDRPQQPAHSYTTGLIPAFANPPSRLSQSLAAAGRRMEDLTPRGELGARSPRQRYSDEAREGHKQKKKSGGFSNFMNNLVGQPRRPNISAPENPVHVTHVGYDSNTGEFTVSTIHGAAAETPGAIWDL